MAIAGMTTPLRKATYKKLVLNAGALLTGFDPSEYATAAALKTALATALADTTKVLGATRGGSTFNFTREMRQVEADGVRYQHGAGRRGERGGPSRGARFRAHRGLRGGRADLRAAARGLPVKRR